VMAGRLGGASSAMRLRRSICAASPWCGNQAKLHVVLRIGISY
jgi:hypothetical protein